MRVFWVLVPIAAALLWWLFSPRASLSEDTNGGLSHASLVERCRERLVLELGSGFGLPTTEEINNQITSSSEEKRWDGWVVNQNVRLEFSCQYTAVSDTVVLEMIR
jgi:hypothetical protein